MSVTPEEKPPHKKHKPMIRKILKTDPEVSDPTESGESHDKTVTEHIEDDEASYSGVVQQDEDRRRD